MLGTMPSSTSSGAAPGFTGEALRIVDRVEREIIRLENSIGRDRLLRTVAGFGGENYATHTGYYRRVIRETIWPHGTWVSGAHADFVRGYGLSALGYVWGGFEALQFFTGASDWLIDQAYEDARGRVTPRTVWQVFSRRVGLPARPTRRPICRRVW